MKIKIQGICITSDQKNKRKISILFIKISVWPPGVRELRGPVSHSPSLVPTAPGNQGGSSHRPSWVEGGRLLSLGLQPRNLQCAYNPRRKQNESPGCFAANKPGRQRCLPLLWLRTSSSEPSPQALRTHSQRISPPTSLTPGCLPH